MAAAALLKVVDGLDAGRDKPERLAWSPSEVAEALGVSRPTVYALLNEGRLPSVYCGARRLIAVSAVRAFLERTE